MVHVQKTIKVGTHEGTSRRDLFQGLVRCRVYTMGQVAGTTPLRGPVTHRYSKIKGNFTEIQGNVETKKERS